jgi:hypothetical protein
LVIPMRGGSTQKGKFGQAKPGMLKNQMRDRNRDQEAKKDAGDGDADGDDEQEDESKEFGLESRDNRSESDALKSS